MPEDTDPRPDTPAGRPDPAAAPDPRASAPGGRPGIDRDLAAVQRGRPERAFNAGLVLGALLAVAAAVFVVQNAQSTEFDWLWLDFELPLWTALLGAMAAGVVLVILAFLVHERRQRRIGRRQQAAGRLRRALGADAPAGGRRARGRPA